LSFMDPNASKTLWAGDRAVRSTKSLKRWYNLINHRFFIDVLPSDVCVRWANEQDTIEEEGCDKKYFGWLWPGEGRHKWIIVISKPKNPGLTAVLNTLAHEMVHVATDNRDEHGKAFSDWHETLTARGLFRKGAVRKGITLF
jgi:SprT-like family